MVNKDLTSDCTILYQIEPINIRIYMPGKWMHLNNCSWANQPGRSQLCVRERCSNSKIALWEHIVDIFGSVIWWSYLDLVPWAACWPLLFSLLTSTQHRHNRHIERNTFLIWDTPHLCLVFRLLPSISSFIFDIAVVGISCTSSIGE